MERINVEELVKELEGKLALRQRKDAESGREGSRRWSVFPGQEDEMVHFKWKDVLDSMRKHPVEATDVVCPVCGEKCVEIYFSSPKWTWKNLCGCAGTMVLCTQCPRQVNFNMEIMN